MQINIQVRAKDDSIEFEAKIPVESGTNISVDSEGLHLSRLGRHGESIEIIKGDKISISISE